MDASIHICFHTLKGLYDKFLLISHRLKSCKSLEMFKNIARRPRGPARGLLYEGPQGRALFNFLTTRTELNRFMIQVKDIFKFCKINMQYIPFKHGDMHQAGRHHMGRDLVRGKGGT